MPKSTQIGGVTGINSNSIAGQGDGVAQKTNADKGAGSCVGNGAWGKIPITAVDPKVHGAGPSPSRPVSQPTSRGK